MKTCSILLQVWYNIPFSLDMTTKQQQQQPLAHRTTRHDAQKKPDMMYSSKLLSYYNVFIVEE